MKTIITMALLSGASLMMGAEIAGNKLDGTPIGTARGYNYEIGGVVENIQNRAFDGDFNTYFATDRRSYGWVGLDLGQPHIITRVGWAARNDGVGPGRLRCGVIQGANSPDFLDAIPLYIIPESGKIGEMTYGEVSSSKGFRYVRFVSTGDARCNIAELEFYGTPGEGDDTNLVQLTNLPTVIVNTVDAEEPYDKEHDITANIIIINDNKIDTEASGTIRERGNASRQFPKKPWRLKFDKKQNILDAPAKAKKWTLLNNYGDKSLMRNIVAFEIARQFDMAYVPYSRAVDVILNGEYKGCYQLCDQVEVNANRVNITEMEPEDITGDALTGGYFIEVDGYADQEPAGEWFYSRYNTPVTIKSPDDGGVTEQYNYIRDYFSRVEELAYTGNYSEVSGYRAMFDAESFIKYFLVQELTGNPDGFWSTYFYKDRLDDKLHAGPVWDFDIAFDNDFRVYPTNNISNFLSLSGKASTAGNFRQFANRILVSDPNGISDREKIWADARNKGRISAEKLSEYIDKMSDELAQSQELNFKRWPILREYVHMNPRVPASYSAECDFLKNYLTTRIDRLDDYLSYDPTLSGVDNIDDTAESEIKVAGDTIYTANGSQFSIYAIDGRKVYEGTTPASALPSGIYIVTKGKQTVKIAL
ncbi:MAG: CotH kinase family protein [Muribaculaceae bacterium]|nr:CotH kinase family protein [Muribaculaceae bacterium]